MFGSNDSNNQDNTAPADDSQVVTPDQTMTSDQPVTTDDQSFLPSVPSVSAVTPAADEQPHESSATEDAALDALVTNPEPPATDDTADTTAPSPTSDTPSESGNSDLLKLKQNALQQLSPLIGHLEQSPEEKFKTLMMMIQAADDQSLVNDAYEAAQAIEDDKVKAQALLDIVNEINYFTQQKDS